MSQNTTRADDPRVREGSPPLPDSLYRVVNPLVTLLLRSPLHPLVSDSIMLITFRGRKTGNEYTTPVGYQREGDTLVVFTHSDWWKNLRGGRPVAVRLRGERRRGVATPLTDPGDVADRVASFVDEHGTDRARRIGLVIEGDGRPSREQLLAALEDTVVIEIRLDEGE
jgi:deazaflavin-dependent oxidoreductase (nitroreductase family)